MFPLAFGGEDKMTQLLTHSRCASFKSCRRRHWFEYELGIRRTIDGKALRMGSAYHAGLESLAHHNDLGDACGAARAYYADIDNAELEMECQTVMSMLCGYQWRWQSSPLEYVAVEQEWQLPLLNPETGRPSTNFDIGGKIDGIVRLEDGRLAVIEHKLLGDDISVESFLWRRMRIDQQVTIYVLAARRLGFDVDCVLYDVGRKPTIKPTQVPMLDDAGLKIVVDADGNRVLNKNGTPRQTASAADGYQIIARDMRPDEWSEKLSNDIAERPDYYFARREVTRLNADIEELQAELWDVQKSLRDAQIENRWFRNVSRQTCDGCSVFELCSIGFDPQSGTLPDGYQRIVNLHPELEVANNASPSPSTATYSAIPASDAAPAVT